MYSIQILAVASGPKCQNTGASVAASRGTSISTVPCSVSRRTKQVVLTVWQILENWKLQMASRGAHRTENGGSVQRWELKCIQAPLDASQFLHRPELASTGCPFADDYPRTSRMAPSREGPELWFALFSLLGHERYRQTRQLSMHGRPVRAWPFN